MAFLSYLKDSLFFSLRPEQCVQYYQKKYGDTFPLQLTPSKQVWISGTAQAAKSLFTAPLNTFTKLEPSDPLEILTGPESLILGAGETHFCQKISMSKLFHKDNMQDYALLMHKHTLAAIQGWNSGETLCLLNEMKRITMTIILTAVFGLEQEHGYNDYRQQAFDLLKSYNPPIMFVPALRTTYWRPWQRFLNARDRFNHSLTDKIQQARANNNFMSKDILSHLVNITSSENQLWDESTLLDHLRTLLVAGHDTASIALTWALTYIFSDPVVYEKLMRELAPFASSFSIDNILTLPYLTAVCKEALRIHPVVPIVMRTLACSFQYGDKQLSAGDTVGLSITLLHSSTSVWKQPTRFLPERFIEAEYPYYHFIPFGGGTKRCLGAAFAMYEMRLVLATILLNAKLKIMNCKTKTPKLHGLTMGPRNSIQAKVISQTSSF